MDHDHHSEADNSRVFADDNGDSPVIENTGASSVENNSSADNQIQIESHEDRQEIKEDDIINSEMKLPTKEANNEGVKATEMIMESTIEITTMSNTLCRHASTYELEKYKHKLLIIFNMFNISGHREPRWGTEVDVDTLKRTFEPLGFTVKTYTDETKNQILEIMRSYGRANFNNCGTIFICILTHGHENLLKGSDGERFSIQDVLNCLDVKENSTLVTKPIVLCIQACHSKQPSAGVPVTMSPQVNQENARHDEGIRVMGTSTNNYQTFLDDDLMYYLPKKSNILVVCSCSEEQSSARDPYLGSWFIQSLCKNTANLAVKHHFVDIIQEILREVALEMDEELINSTTASLDIIKQMPVFKSTLIRYLYLRKYEQQPPLHLQTVQCPCDFIKIIRSLVEWILVTITFLYKEDYFEYDVLRRQVELKKYEQVRENIKSSAPDIQERSKKERRMVQFLLKSLSKIKAKLRVVLPHQSESSNEEGVEQCDDEQKLEQMLNTVMQLIDQNLNKLGSSFLVILNQIKN